MSLNDISIINNEIISSFENIVGKLSLFSEKDHNTEETKIKFNQILERPVTPVEQEITDAPKSLKEFLYLLQRRISICKNCILSEEDQLSLLGIIEGEIGLLWPDLNNLINYPLFNDDNNRELKTTMFIEIITKCRQLFQEYIDKMSYYCNKDIFSDESNLVRIKLQLASDIRHTLHIPTLRRHIYQNITQGSHINIPKCCEVPSIEKVEEKYQHGLHDNKSRTTETDCVASYNDILVRDKHHSVKMNNKGTESNDQTNPRDSDTQQSEDLNPEKNRDLNFKEIFDTKTKDLFHLMDEEVVDSGNDCFPKMVYAMPSLEKCAKRNEDLQKKIEILKTHNEERKKSAKYVIRPPLVEQPSTIPICYNNSIYSVPDIRPTVRKSECELSISLYGPVWNELADEITPEIVKKLDSNLFRGEEVKDIYKEMMKTVSRDYMNYDNDPIIEECPSKVYIQDIMASHSLHSDTKKDRIINPKLKSYLESPWKSQSKSFSDWKHPDYTLENSSASALDLRHYVEMSLNELANKTNFGRVSYGESLSSGVNSSREIGTSLGYIADTPNIKSTSARNIIPKQEYILSSEKFEKGISRLPKLMLDRLSKQYNEWLLFWKRSFDADDFLKYLSLQPTDFLNVIFHNYDSNEEDNTSEDNNDEEFLYPEMVEQKHRLIEREKERQSILENEVCQLQAKKDHYEKGLWNPSIILIGGLGKTPILSHNERQELLKEKPSLPDPSDNLHKRTAYSRAKSAVSPGKPTPLFVRKKNSLNKSETSENLLTTSNEDQRLTTIQNRLEQIWNKLKMPNHLRLDMAIKYSSEINIKVIEKVLQLWDGATSLLLEREKVLLELEDFERIASDPNRFFIKGYRGSSMARLDESKIRQELNKKIDLYSSQIANTMKELKITCSDELSYEGRPYGDKMRWDRTEMLYWLQEERKERFLNEIIDHSTIN